MRWTTEKLATLSQQELNNLYQNARRVRNDVAMELLEVIENSGLAYSDPTGLKLDSPLGLAMQKIVNSKESVAAAIAATEQGQPALGGVDALLFEQLGREYSETYEATIQAGYLVAKMMRRNGYFGTRVQGRIEGGVAKTGEIYRKN